jgi:hypothetical protein
MCRSTFLDVLMFELHSSHLCAIFEHCIGIAALELGRERSRLDWFLFVMVVS